MNITFLFNSDHDSLGSYYGLPIMRSILEVGILQSSERNMRVLLGDVLTCSTVARSKTPTIEYLLELCEAIYKPTKFDYLLKEPLSKTHGQATIFCWTFQNITEEVAISLHHHLIKKEFYLGAMDVVFSNPLHLFFFRNGLIEYYRFEKKMCSIFYDKSADYEPDMEMAKVFEEYNFLTRFEDSGLRRTIFDNYDSLEHFRRVDAFNSYFSSLFNLTIDYVSDFTHNIEELHPKLFDTLAAAARTLERAETEEDYAQAALSGRRFLEQVADYLFPPQSADWNGRKVGQSQYKNRLWAYIEKIVNQPSQLSSLGKGADRLVNLFNAGLHTNPTRKKVEQAFYDLICWLSAVIELSPVSVRKPYLAYLNELKNVLDYN